MSKARRPQRWSQCQRHENSHGSIGIRTRPTCKGGRRHQDDRRCDHERNRLGKVAKRRDRYPPRCSMNQAKRPQKSDAEPKREPRTRDHEPQTACFGLLRGCRDRRSNRLRQSCRLGTRLDIVASGGCKSETAREEDGQRESPEEEPVGEAAAENAAGNLLVPQQPAKRDLHRRMPGPRLLEGVEHPKTPRSQRLTSCPDRPSRRFLHRLRRSLRADTPHLRPPRSRPNHPERMMRLARNCARLCRCLD